MSHGSRTSASDTDCAKRRLNLLPGGLVDLEDRGLAGRLVDRPAGKPFGVVQGFTENATAIQDRKERGVLDQLPEAERPRVRAKLRKAWRNPDLDQAILDLRALGGRLSKTYPKAAIRMFEGLDNMFRVIRLGVPGAMLKTVMSTQPVESMIEIVRNHARTVNYWQLGAVHGKAVTT
jgi:hypothetical protein